MFKKALLAAIALFAKKDEELPKGTIETLSDGTEVFVRDGHEMVVKGKTASDLVLILKKKN